MTRSPHATGCGRSRGRRWLRGGWRSRQRRRGAGACRQARPDIVLLDIRMPGMEGIETAHHLNAMETPPAVVFTTAYDEYAIDAFEARAIGYVLKPVRRARLTARSSRLRASRAALHRSCAEANLEGNANTSARSAWRAEADSGDEIRLFPRRPEIRLGRPR